MADAAETNRILLGRFEEFCFWLFPKGQKHGNHFLLGGLDGSDGKSLQITLSGAAAGRFKDFANPEHDKGGTPIYLLSKAKGIAYRDAVKVAKEWLGLSDDEYGIKKHKAREWSNPTMEERRGTSLAESNSPAMDYLVVNRKIDPLVVARAKIADWTSEDGGVWVVFPYFDLASDREAFHLKKLRIERPNGKKEMFASRGTRRSLYGKHLIDDNVSELVITEGEIDCLSLHSVGVPAVSVPNGVSDMVWVDVDWEWLDRFERIIVWYDMDDPGKLAALEAAKRLGLHRTFIVSCPHKDANEALCGGVSRDEFLKWLADAKPIELDEIKRPNEYTEEVCDYFLTDWSKRGWETPWWPALPWRVRKAEYTVLSGFSGHGKTPALNHLMLHLIQQGCKVMDASLEVKPGMTLYNMSRCALGKKNATEAEIRACIAWLSDSMLFLDCIGTVGVDRLMHAMEYARKRHGVDVFVIDSLFKCGLSSEDYGAQRAFADRLTTFCNNTGSHVILVAHSRKVSTGNEYSIPSKSDVSGSSDITNAAFNVLIWWRHKLKKQKLDELRQNPIPNLADVKKWEDAHDGVIFLDKQRFGEGEEAKVNVWHDRGSMQFQTTPNIKIPYFRVE